MKQHIKAPFWFTFGFCIVPLILAAFAEVIF